MPEFAPHLWEPGLPAMGRTAAPIAVGNGGGGSEEHPGRRLFDRIAEGRQQHGEQHRQRDCHQGGDHRAGDHLAQGNMRHAKVAQEVRFAHQWGSHGVTGDAEQRRGYRVGHVFGHRAGEEDLPDQPEGRDTLDPAERGLSARAGVCPVHPRLTLSSGPHWPFCRSGLVPRKGCKAAPAIYASVSKPWGCFAARSRHKAAPTGRCMPLSRASRSTPAGVWASGHDAGRPGNSHSWGCRRNHRTAKPAHLVQCDP